MSITSHLGKYDWANRCYNLVTYLLWDSLFSFVNRLWHSICLMSLKMNVGNRNRKLPYEYNEIIIQLIITCMSAYKLQLIDIRMKHMTAQSLTGTGKLIHISFYPVQVLNEVCPFDVFFPCLLSFKSVWLFFSNFTRCIIDLWRFDCEIFACKYLKKLKAKEISFE